MARTRTWFAIGDQANDPSWPIAIDLLQGSGLAVVGATVRRTLGTLQATTVTAFSNRLPVFRFGVLVTANADGSELNTANWNDHDWLYLTQQIPRSLLQPIGESVITSTADPSGSWDTNVSRKLEAGESLWLVVLPINADTSSGNQYRYFSRTLVLNPA